MDSMGQQEEKIIYNFIPIERNLCITVSEIKALLNYYPYGQRHRLCFAIMAVAGLRTSEVVNLRLDGFLNPDLTKFRYRVSKYKIRKYDTGTKVINIKTRIAEIPKWLAEELKYYIARNFHIFEDGFIFPFSADSLRRYLNDLREKARYGRIKDPFLTNALLEKTGESVTIGTKKPDRFRISCHSFRRFYLTYIYHAVYNKDVALVQRDIGHDLKETTYSYVYKPENIGLNRDLIDCLKKFEVLVESKDQSRLMDFID